MASSGEGSGTDSSVIPLGLEDLTLLVVLAPFLARFLVLVVVVELAFRLSPEAGGVDLPLVAGAIRTGKFGDEDKATKAEVTSSLGKIKTGGTSDRRLASLHSSELTSTRK
jgi:hypothetical protein